ncbi:alpha/beta fold hydrolase [Streptomyces mayteni]
METQGYVRTTDGARLRWTALRDAGGGQPPVVLLHGGPGLPDYLGDVARMVADVVPGPVYRYDQRGTGGSPWRGRHSLARRVDDLVELLDGWDAPEAVLIGHSYGTDLASRCCLRYPDRVAAMLLMCGPFVGDWHAGYRAERDRRRVLGDVPPTRRTEEQEVELLTLSWFTDGRADPLDGHLAALRARLPTRTELLAGCEDPRPVAALVSLARRLDLPLTRIEGGGREPWVERGDAVRACLRRFLGGVPTTRPPLSPALRAVGPGGPSPLYRRARPTGNVRAYPVTPTAGTRRWSRWSRPSRCRRA